jgi:hypothetical protein
VPISWDEVEAELDQALDAARQRTNDKLASQISSLTRLTDAEVKELFPTPADVGRLVELLKIVKSAEERNRKVARLAQNIEKLGGAVVALLERFA